MVPPEIGWQRPRHEDAARTKTGLDGTRKHAFSAARTDETVSRPSLFATPLIPLGFEVKMPGHVAHAGAAVAISEITQKLELIGRHYLYNAPCLIRPRPFYVFVVASGSTISCYILRHR